MFVVASFSAALVAARVSHFQRPIDVEALAAQYSAGDMAEDADWHEDTYEWRDKVREKHAKPFDVNELQAGGPIDPAAIQALIDTQAAAVRDLKELDATRFESLGNKDPKVVEAVAELLRLKALLEE